MDDLSMTLPGGTAMNQQHKRKGLLTLGIVAVVAGVTSMGAFAAFTATTENTGNQIRSGTVKIDQHAGATTLYDVADQKPGDSTASCVRVTYAGSLDAAVTLDVSGGITDGSLYNLKIERGSGLSAPAADMNCSGFTATSTAYDGDLGGFSGTDGKAGAADWLENDSVDYRFTISQKDDPTVNAHTTVTSSGAHTFTWEAQSK
jgi:predicted ribosomally synthesized peptide with SipW-like signal peptide